MKIVYLAFCIFYFSTAIGQIKDPFPYKFSSSIYEKIKTDSNQWKGGVTSSDLSFIGLYKEAVQEWDKPRLYTRKISKADSLEFVKTYKPIDAKEFILEKAKENRVLILNEAHYNSRNRVFLTSLLKDLKKLGYTYFAAETFSNRPGFQENSKYPNLNTGYYTMEPQFGNLIREANKLNYTLYPYESSSRGGVNTRDSLQARNLAKLLDSIPDMKLIIYCGFDHIVEEAIPNWGIPMATRLKEFTQIDPYTIDQTVLSEKSIDSLNNPYFKLIKAEDYAILINKKDNAFNKMKKVDALLYSPPTKYMHNRPGWIFENGKSPFFLNKDSINISYPFIAKVYFNEQDINNNVIPIDIMEIKNEQELLNTAMAVFNKKEFIIQLIDTKAESQVIKVNRN